MPTVFLGVCLWYVLKRVRKALQRGDFLRTKIFDAVWGKQVVPVSIVPHIKGKHVTEIKCAIQCALKKYPVASWLSSRMKYFELLTWVYLCIKTWNNGLSRRTDIRQTRWTCSPLISAETKWNQLEVEVYYSTFVLDWDIDCSWLMKFNRTQSIMSH